MRDDVQDQAEDETLVMGELLNSPGFLLRIAQVRAFDAFFARTQSHGIKPGEFTVLWVISLNPGLKQGTIARKLHIKPAHMTKLTARMVADGLVERHTPPDDRRAVWLTLTAKGQDFVQRNRDDLLDLDLAENSPLTTKEAATLNTLLRKFTGLDQDAP